MNILDIQRQTREFSSGGGINLAQMDYTSGPEPLQIHAGYVDAGFLETLGVPPLLGRTISPEEDVKGGPRVIVVSHQFWQDFLNADPHVLGKTVTLTGNDYTVIGVMPAGFAPPEEHADVYVSLWVAYPEAAPYRGVHFMRSYWRLKPGVTLAQAQADISSIDHRLAELYPGNEKTRKTLLVPLHEFMVRDSRAALLVLFGAVGFVLLIACANFAGLLVARNALRRQELLIRAALGAGRIRLIRQALVESALLSVIGGSAGLLLAKWCASFLFSLKPAALERFTGVQRRLLHSRASRHPRRSDGCLAVRIEFGPSSLIAPKRQRTALYCPIFTTDAWQTLVLACLCVSVCAFARSRPAAGASRELNGALVAIS